MAPISISNPEYSMEDGWHVASASIYMDHKTYQLKFRVSEGPISKNSDPFLAAALFPAMKIGQPLQITGTVSQKLLAATQTMQDTYHKWFPEFQKIPVRAEAGLPDWERQSADVGAFFSGGVDSFYTLLKNHDEITRLILINGIMFENASERPKVIGEIRSVAEALGKSLVVVEVNIRDLSDEYTYWEDQYAGVALASVGLLLAPQFRKIYFASSFPYEDWKPTAIHPLLEPLFSTESVKFEIDASDVGRPEKVAFIAQSELAMKYLHACSREFSYNCGKCEKCMRTMLALQAIGAIERCETFPQRIDPEAVSRIQLDELRDIYAKENLRALEKKGGNDELTDALRSCINTYKYQKIAASLNEDWEKFIASQQWVQFAKGKRNMLLRSLWNADPEWLFREAVKERIKDVDRKYIFGMLKRIAGALGK
jgi:7-cyano-7-deazaguanine synthase in queuosine biosynthesis